MCKTIYGIYGIVKTIVSAYEPNSADEFYWLDKVFENFNY